MAEIIRMPKMSDTMTEGVIASWLKKVGDKVKSGDILAEVETDKATMELESYYDGVLLYIGIQEKQAVPVDGVIAIIGQAGEDISAVLAQLGNASASATAAAQTSAPAAEPVAVAAPTAPQSAPAVKVNATVIRMPKMSDTMTEGVIAAWLKKVGDKVKSGDILAEVETDKATMELESYEDGTLLYIGVEAGKSVPVDGIIAIIGEAGADYQALLNQQSAPVAQTAAPATVAETAVAAPVTTSAAAPATQSVAGSSTAEGGRIKASPLAKRLAKEKGLDISQIKGTGEHGRIVKRDVETFVPAAAPAKQESAVPVAMPQRSTAAYEESFTELPVSQMRKTIARRLSESAFTAPHFFLTVEINMDKAMAARQSMNEVAPVKISFNDMIIKACAVALRKHPMVNASWQGDKIRVNHHIHIGVAVAVEDGLLVPVVRFADTKSLSEISAEVKELGSKAKNKKLQPADWAGNTFSISNLGMFGIEEFTSIINQPDSCILSVGAIRQVPVVADGQIRIGNVMKVTLACDHRVVDGATGAAFLQTLVQLMEDPVRILI
ncbi:pyruvate dehydrogenase complex dihydrolipoamide acetyltransferase [Rhodoflexus caldus]|uniref:pyruvate dehydrogenase complex dihydrolipoamide acetyltransferase n=1 Tax=Rhodoflexus caldus TaxID=2891236 RepID=UPI00202A8774|nr:pyruvate dehydrogenase complex dihydrolipoamide acetyltransferase [Rhodoflexus caldus]